MSDKELSSAGGVGVQCPCGPTLECTPSAAWPVVCKGSHHPVSMPVGCRGITGTMWRSEIMMVENWIKLRTGIKNMTPKDFIWQLANNTMPAMPCHLLVFWQLSFVSHQHVVPLHHPLSMAGGIICSLFSYYLENPPYGEIKTCRSTDSFYAANDNKLVQVGGFWEKLYEKQKRSLKEWGLGREGAERIETK